MFRKRFPLCGRFTRAAALLLLATPVFAQGGPLENTVRNLARRVLPVIQGNRVACLTWQNRGALPEALSTQLRAAFLAELQDLRIAGEQDAQPCILRVLIDRTPTWIVFAAQISTGEAGRVLIDRIPRGDAALGEVSNANPRLQKELLWQQSERILDALQIPDSSGQLGLLAILARDSVSILRKESTDWKVERSWPLVNISVDRRAPRGELQPDADRAGFVRIIFPAAICEFDPADAVAPACQARSEEWRSQVRLHSQCGTAPWELSSGSGDWSVPDRIALIDPSLPKQLPPLAEINVPGPVLSLASNDVIPAATAVVFNLTTGNYQVYAVTLDCAN